MAVKKTDIRYLIAIRDCERLTYENIGLLADRGAPAVQNAVERLERCGAIITNRDDNGRLYTGGITITPYGLRVCREEKRKARKAANS